MTGSGASSALHAIPCAEVPAMHQPLVTDIRTAYESHDRDALERALVRLERQLSCGMACAATHLVHLDTATLAQRRGEVLTTLGCITTELQRREGLRAGITAQPAPMAGGSLEGSE